jgi:hypothetical protein
MAATIAQVMQGIEARLATIEGLRTKDVTPDQISPPCAFVGVPPMDYRLTMGRASYLIKPTITVLVSAAWDRVGQLKLAGYANPTGSTSVIAAIEGDRTLGGIADDCVVDDFEPLGMEEVGAIGYYGGRFSMRVVLDGN